MAIKTGKSGTYNISTGNQYISGYVEWVETYDDANYESTNKTTITQKAYLHRTNTYTSAYGISSNGTRKTYFGSDVVTNNDHQDFSIPGNPPGGYICVSTASKEITHNDDGTKTITLGFEMSNTAGITGYKVAKTTKDVTLMTIPRWATITEHYVAAVGTNHITVHWNANTNCNGLQCSLNGGGWFDVSGYPEYTLTGLAANTAYSIRTRVRKTASGYWTESGTIYATTQQVTPVIHSFNVSGRTSTSITCSFTCDWAHTYYYKLSGWSNWIRGANNINSGTFTISDLAPNTNYTVELICRNWINESNDTYKDARSSVVGTTFAQTIPSIWETGKTSSSISVNSGCNVAVNHTAYRIRRHDGGWGNWQSSGSFGGLSPSTTYVVQVEKRGSASGEYGYAEVWIATHPQTIASISLGGKTSTSLTVIPGCNIEASSVQYRIRRSGGTFGNWQNSNVFTGLTPATTYIVEVNIVGKVNGESSIASLREPTYNATIPTIAFNSNTVKSITVTSDCNVAVRSTLYRIKKSTDTAYGAWQTSNVFSNLVYNTAYDIQVEKIGTESGEYGYATLTNVYTRDIARITDYNSNWSVEDSITFSMTNVGSCIMRLYLLYNGVEIIYRNNISLTNGQYTFTLTTGEKNSLYSLAAGETNPNFKFVLRSYYESVIVGSDSEKAVSIEFPTKAWTKINNNWKRALVWGKMNNTWRQSLPWVKINNVWKRI